MERSRDERPVLTVGRDTLTLEPVLVCDGAEWTLDGARLSSRGARLEAEWPDGTRLALDVARSAHGSVVGVAVTAGGSGLSVDHVGFRLRDPGSDRILPDGYQSWDWCGLRDLRHPGTGWWGAIWGGRGRTSRRLALVHPPEAGDLALRWDGDGTLEALLSAPPDQATFIEGGPSPLRRRLAAGETLTTDDVVVGALDSRDPGGAALPRPPRGAHRPRPRIAGWMSWNSLSVTVRPEEVPAADRMTPPGGYLLLDDGWIEQWGDWEVSPRFGTPLHRVAEEVHDRGRRFGVWIAPFLVSPCSKLAAEHPDWLLTDETGAPVWARRAPLPHRVLDASIPAVREHLRTLGERLGRDGAELLKLDFLYGGSLAGARRDGMTGVQALRAGTEALLDGYRSVRRDGYVIACGAPGPPMVGLVDTCRSGSDTVFPQPSGSRAPDTTPGLSPKGVIEAQVRNTDARAWLWGATLPPDVDAVNVGPAGAHRLDRDLTLRWLHLAERSGGPVLSGDDPSLPLQRSMLRRLHAVAGRVMGRPPVPARLRGPLAGTPLKTVGHSFITGAFEGPPPGPSSSVPPAFGGWFGRGIAAR